MMQYQRAAYPGSDTNFLKLFPNVFNSDIAGGWPFI
jgi:hypothetical protein